MTRNGDLYLENLRSAKAIDRYTLSGIGDEEFLPRHTFHGFRYIKIVIKGSANIKFLEAIAYRSSLKRIGKIRTSNSLVNKIYSNIIWSQKDNNLSIPTDCPQRDERMGWTGDAQVFAETACYNFNSHKFLKNYCNCLMDSMDEVSDGVPVFSPFFHRLEEGKPICAQGWSDAIIIIPYTLYLYYGDKAFLRKTLPYMKRYLKYVRKHCLDNNGLYDSWSFGDWLSVFEETDKQFYDNCYYAYDNYLISRVCNILGNKSEQEFYQRYLKSKQLTRNKYMHNDGTIANDTQGAYVLAYKLKIASLEEVKDNIVRKVEQFGHLTTGFHSTKSLLPLLSEIGRSDLAYNLLLNKKYPSWGYEISCGATTIWERWDSYRKDVGFNPDGMNSFNHYSLGAVGEWMYQYMMGIRPNENLPAFKKTLISPYFDRRITHFKGSYKSNSGLIEVEYKILNDQVFYNIKADHNIELEFRFKNPVISKIESKDNSYQFVIAL